jgi:hypothetical protein
MVTGQATGWLATIRATCRRRHEQRARDDSPTGEASEAAAPAPSAKADLAVVFVHGVGQQLPGQTLVKFADPISEWLARWVSEGEYTEAHPSAPGMENVKLVGAALAGVDPAHVELELRVGTKLPLPGEQRWLLCESWWAQSFDAPSARALLLWMLWILPYLSIIQFYAQFRRAIRSPSQRSIAGVLGWIGRIAFYLAIYLCALPAAALGAIVIIVLFVALVLPIPQLSEYAKKVTLLLSNTIGDCYVLVGSATQFDAMVARVSKDIEWASARAEHLAIVAHSQGAAVAYQALSGSTPPNARAFVTIGEAIKKLSLIQNLQTYGRRRRAYGTPSLSALSHGRELRDEGIGGTTRSLMARWFRLPSLRFTIGWIGVIATFGLLYTGPQLAIVLLRAGRQLHAGPLHNTHHLLYVVFASSLIMVLIVLRLCYRLWSEDLRVDLRPLGTIEHPVRWANFYASADPVSNGPLFAYPDDAQWFEREVWNFGSVIRDHTTYTASEDDFLGCVVAQLARASGHPFGRELTNRLVRARWRGWWRVWWLSVTRFLAVAAAISSLVSVNGHISTIGRRVIKWHWWPPLRPIGKSIVASVKKLILIGHPTNQQVVGGLTVFGTIVAGYLLLALIWSYWQRQDIKRFYRQESSDSDPLGGRELYLFLLVLIAELFVTGTVAATGDYSATWNWCTGHRLITGGIILATLLAPVFLAWATRDFLRAAEVWLMRHLPREQDPASLPEDGSVEGTSAVPATGS